MKRKRMILLLSTNVDNNTIWPISQGGFGEFPPRKTTKLFRPFLCNLANCAPRSTMQKKAAIFGLSVLFLYALLL